jgi:hypothetical protein
MFSSNIAIIVLFYWVALLAYTNIQLLFFPLFFKEKLSNILISYNLDELPPYASIPLWVLVYTATFPIILITDTVLVFKKPIHEKEIPTSQETKTTEDPSQEGMSQVCFDFDFDLRHYYDIGTVFKETNFSLPHIAIVQLNFNASVHKEIPFAKTFVKDLQSAIARYFYPINALTEIKINNHNKLVFSVSFMVKNDIKASFKKLIENYTKAYEIEHLMCGVSE